MNAPRHDVEADDVYLRLLHDIGLHFITMHIIDLRLCWVYLIRLIRCLSFAQI